MGASTDAFRVVVIFERQSVDVLFKGRRDECAHGQTRIVFHDLRCLGIDVAIYAPDGNSFGQHLVSEAWKGRMRN